MRTAALVILAAVGSQGCAELGYSDRVLHRVPSPADSTLVAVCQEIPELDGPSYDIRLERPDETVVRRLYRIGDGDPCHELAWASDGRTLAVLSSHVARAIVVDVAEALSQPEPKHWSWTRSVSLTRQDGKQLARRLRFVAPGEIEYEVCAHELGRGIDWRVCTGPAEARRLRLPGRTAASDISAPSAAAPVPARVAVSSGSAGPAANPSR
jgi:hypothetical protein